MVATTVAFIIIIITARRTRSGPIPSAASTIARFVIEDDKAVLYHCLDNLRVYHGTPLSLIEFELDDAPALEQLLTIVDPR